MFENEISENVLDINVDDLFKDPEDSQLPNEPPESEPEVNMTETMTKRINKVRLDTELATLEKVAKEAGYESYAAMKKSQEENLVRKHGFDPKDIEAVLEPLLEQRIAADPRLKKLDEFEQQQKDIYMQTQLAAINKTTNQQLKPTDLDKETLELWSKGVDLEKAYYAIHGRTIIAKGASQLQNGTLNHLAPGSGVGKTKTRPLTEAEKNVWRSIVPGITEKELAEKTTQIKGE